MKSVLIYIFLLLVFTVLSQEIPFSCANEEEEKAEEAQFDSMAICPAPRITSCDHRDKIASYTNPPNIIVPIVYYGVDCHASDVAGFPAKVKETTYNLNKWFKQIGIWFEASYVTLPCKGVSGTHDMTNPSDSQITSFQASEVIPLSTRKFRVLISRKASDVRYAGFFGLSTKYGYFHYGSMTIPLVAPHELGHGFGLRHTFFRTTKPVSSCDCAENDNTIDDSSDFKGDYCGDTPGCPQIQSRTVNIPVTSLSNGCPKNESFWINPINNVMSYNFGTQLEFSTCQIKRARCTWETLFKKNTDFKNTTELTCFGKNFENACSNKGLCVGNDKCVCDPGYLGADCSVYKCNGILQGTPGVCSGFGKCVAQDKCECNTGHTNQYCDKYTCFGTSSTSTSVCSGHGKCVSYNTCNCTEPWGGSKCHLSSNNVCYGLNAIDPKSCGGSTKGECIGTNNCKCNTGYSERDCSFYQCFGKNYTDSNACSGKGTCDSYNSCNCSSGYSGNECQFFGVPSPKLSPKISPKNSPKISPKTSTGAMVSPKKSSNTPQTSNTAQKSKSPHVSSTNKLLISWSMILFTLIFILN